MLEGSIRRAGKRVRIAAQLIDTTNGGDLWADRYDRDLTDIFEVQDDVTHRIVDALKINLSRRERTACRYSTSKTSDVVEKATIVCSCAAANSCSGRKRNLETFGQAIKYFRQALEHDPNYRGLCLPGLRLHVRLPKPLDRGSRRLVADRQGVRPAVLLKRTRTNRWRDAYPHWRRRTKRISIAPRPRSMRR